MRKFYTAYLTLFIGLGAYNTFLPVYLEKSLGFTSSQVGLIVSIPSIIGIIFVFATSNVLDFISRIINDAL